MAEKTRRVVGSLPDKALAASLVDLREMAGALGVRLFHWPDESCCAAAPEPVPGNAQVMVATCTDCPRRSQDQQAPLAATPFWGDVPFLFCVTTDVTTGGILALQMGFASPSQEVSRDQGRLARLAVPVLMWAKLARERQALEAQVATLASRSQAELAAALKAQEEEREWVAYEIHDRVGQTLASAFQQLQAAEALAQSLPQLRPVVIRGAMLCREALREARHIMNELSPSAIEDLGLVPLVEEWLRRLEDETQCRVQASLNYLVPPPREVAIVVYRVLSEALTNIQRHAHAQGASVTLECLQDEVCLRVKDNGVGFDLPAALARKRVGGLMSMQRRAALAGGRLHLESQPGGGTVVSLWVPWPKRRREDRSQ